MKTYAAPSNDECSGVPAKISFPMTYELVFVEIGLDFSPPCAHVRVLPYGVEECVSS